MLFFHQNYQLEKQVDNFWMDHIDAMDDLKGSVGLHAYAQRVRIERIRGSIPTTKGEQLKMSMPIASQPKEALP